MLRARYGHSVILGLSDANIAALRENRPIMVELRSIGFDTDASITIFWGKTELEMEKMLTDNGLIGEDTQKRVDPRLDQEEAQRRDNPLLKMARGLEILSKYYKPDTMIYHGLILAHYDDDISPNDVEALDECGWVYSPDTGTLAVQLSNGAK